MKTLNQFQKDLKVYGDDKIVKDFQAARKALHKAGFDKMADTVTWHLKKRFRHLNGGTVKYGLLAVKVA